ncbi:IS3 family transposase [Lacrimispora saccharolytica]|uniref:IS3 family transposase n=1 Tax=Lacrimispora saccharolytica TaxID=84030 RepID=UPI001F61425A|nr:IS3 family transposase [Lacrimispora saccharolytica]
MNSNLHLYTVKQLCNALKFPRSTYYKALVSVPSNKQLEYEEFSKKVIYQFNKYKQRYGAIKLQRVLSDAGTKCSIKRVQRHMVKNGLRSVVVKKYNHHSSKNNIPEKENILNRHFEADTINQKWCTDITYIHVLKEGWTYLASVMDLYTRKIIGYAYGKEITAELAKKAVENACLNVKNTKGIILHSDLGVQYTSQLFENYINSKKMIHSFSHKGNPYDNACIESFHATLKKEEIYRHTYRDFNEANRAIFEYIESWYNRIRIHSSIDFMTPQQKEDEALGVA